MTAVTLPSALRLVPARWAVAALLTMLLAGCKIAIPSVTASSGAGPGSAPGPARSGSLITEPNAGFGPIYTTMEDALMTVVPLVVTWDFTGPIPFAIQVRIRMVTETPMKFSASVSSMTLVW